MDQFIAGISRAALTEPLRNSDSLRKRHCRGFRPENMAVPQLINAYVKEVIERCDGDLASYLCAQWIIEHEDIATLALHSLGISANNPGDARSWIAPVHEKLATNQYDVRSLIRTLAETFSLDDVRIFISIIGYDADQDALRRSVDEQLLELSKDPQFQKQRVERELEAAKTTLENLDKSRVQITTDEKTELNKIQTKLDQTRLEHDMAASSLAADDADLQSFTKQLAELKTTLTTRQRARETTKQQKEQLAKSLERQQKQLLTTQGSYEKSRKELDQHLQEQTTRLASLTTELDNINRTIAAAEEQRQIEEDKRRREQQQVRERQRVQEQHPQQPPTQVPTTAPPPPIPDVPKTLIELVGNNAICYQGIQRTFRNSVVQFLRERLPRLYPTDHVQRMKKVFGQEWETAVQNANKSREILGTTTTIRDEYDLLGTNHFFGIFEKFFDKLFTPEAGQSENVPKPVKARFLGNVKAIKDGRDPLSHPVEEEIPFEEAHHLLIEAKQILKWLGYETQAAELSALAGQLNGGGSEKPETLSVVRRLPSEDSIYREFVGRDTLLKDLALCFANPDNRRCLLAGDGGKGKSAAAYRFAQQLSAAPGRFQLIVWLSAKRRKFREGTMATIDSPDFTTAEEAITRLLREYGATDQDLAQPLKEKKQRLFEFLETLPAFIIADDIDTVLEDHDVVSLFTHEIPHTQSAVLLTSRRDIPGVRSFVLKGFDTAEAEQFVNSRIQLYGLDPAIARPSLLSEINRVTDGSPLYMDDLMRLTRIVDVKSAIRMWQEKKGDEARKYALQRELERLSSDARNVLIAAAVTDDAISFAELEGILEISEDRLLAALSELQTLFLFPRAPLVEGEQRYQINLNTKKLVRLVESSTDLYARIERASKALAGKLPHVGHTIVSPLIRQAHLRLSAGQNTEAETILRNAIQKYPNAPDLRGFLGYAYKRIRRIADARTQFEAAYKLKAKNPEMFLQWIKMEIAEKEWSKAINVADRALKVIPDCYEIIERKVTAQRQAGFDLYAGLHREKAEKMWAEAVEEVKRRIKPPEALQEGARELNASMYYTIVVCLDMLERLRDRNGWLERWEKEHPDDPEVARQKEYLNRKRGGLHVGAY